MINTREIAEEYRLSHWAQIMQERIQMGLSIKDFCKQISICQNTYFYWQRRVRAAACEKLSVIPEPKEQKSIVPNGWATLRINDESAHPQELTVEVGGCRIVVHEDTNMEILAEVCRTLKAL